MGRGTKLSDEEGAKIMAYVDIGYSPHAIAQLLGRSRCAVVNHIKRVQNGVKLAYRGHARVTTELADRRIIRLASNSTSTSSRILADLDLPCSSRTIRRRIKASGIIKYRKMSRKPVLKALEMQRRVVWARDHIHWHGRWKNIVFSDEKRFCLDGPDGNVSYYHDYRKPELVRNRRHSGGGSVMIWAAIGYYGKSNIAFVDNTMNSEKYMEVLTEYLLPRGVNIGRRQWVFMQDNAPVHKSYATMAFCMPTIFGF